METNNADEAGSHIWLRYATQYTKDGRSHTIEMGIPVPLGADSEARAKLIREAEVGMNQLINHVEQRLPQMVQRNQQASQSSVPAPVQGARTAPQQQRPAPIGNKPASASAPQTATQPVNATTSEREAGQEQPQVARTNTTNGPQARQMVGADMPQAFSPTNTDSGNLLLPEFIQHIKENLDMNPKQAMEILKVKSLSGINLREALEQLRRWRAQNSVNGVGEQKEAINNGGEQSSPRAISFSIPPAKVEPAATIIEDTRQAVPSEPTNSEAVREASPAYIRFDEEVDAEETEPLEDLEDVEEAPEFTPQELEQARARISHLREFQGATTASDSRVKALTNVVAHQISDEQLRDLVAAVWHVTSLKKLKVDQVEALVSWGKEDDFISEVEAVLVSLEEEPYARGNR